MTQPNINNVLVVGAGWVGRQIAARFAIYGVNVYLSDRDPTVSSDAVSWVEDVLRNRFESTSSETASHALPPQDSASESTAESADSAAHPGFVRTAPDFASLSDTWEQRDAIDLVLECVPEQVSLKKRVLRQISSLFPQPVIIASNSSYFVPSLLSKYVTSPERFANIHFHVPVLKDSVVDIVGCEETQAATLASLKELTQRIKHEPLMLRNEHPGYIFNWILQAVLKASLELAAKDVADPADIDKSWKAVTGMPVGPFAMMDRIGLDVVEQVLANSKWGAVESADVDTLRKLLTTFTDQGHLGVKTRRGFYEYDAEIKDDLS